MNRYLQLIILLPLFSFVLFISGCTSSQGGVYETEDICMSGVETGSFGEFFGNPAVRSLEYIHLHEPSEDYMFTETDKVICKNGRLYILDWIGRKILTFDMSGNPVSGLARRGRGPGEYLQITDFDVDETGCLWVLDGQHDRIMCYGEDNECLSSTDVPYEVSFMKCMPGETFLLGLSPWDKSRFGGKKVLVADRDLDVISAYIDYGKSYDSDCSFPTTGFTDGGNCVFYHQPVDDNVYRISADGRIEHVIHFDFGRMTIPDEFRTDIEKYRDEFGSYRTLVKSVYVDDAFVVGSIIEGRKTEDFILDRGSSRMYVSGSDVDRLRMVGISDSLVVFRVLPGTGAGSGLVPHSVLDAVDAGADVFAVASGFAFIKK